MSNPNINLPSLDPGSGTFGRRHSAKNIGVDETVAHNSLRGYMIGFVLSIILTAIPFGLVMFPSFPRETIVATILVMAVVQVVVHVFYFLHLDGSIEERWNVSAFVFTMLITVIVVGGSVWVMYHATENMEHHMNSNTGEEVVPQR
jgi:cytochrome o ubiquinol oxidase operon protein cyoD